ncbi:MAG: ubiquinol-cytochrome C chaperone family protein [Hyphomonas sp.]
MSAFSASWWRRRGARNRAVQAAYETLLREALSPRHYLAHGAADTFEGRARMVTVLTALACHRLAAIGGPEAADLAEYINRKVLDGFDAAYREKGVGDHSIARKVRTLAEAHSGLGRALMTALETAESGAGPDPLVAVLVRNEVSPAAAAPAMAAALRALQQAFQAQPDAEILAGTFACGGKPPES